MPVNWKNKIRPNHFAVTTFNSQVFFKNIYHKKSDRFS